MFRHSCPVAPTDISSGVVRRSFITFYFYALSLEYPQALSSSIYSADAGQRLATPVCEVCDQLVNTLRWIHWIFMPPIVVPLLCE